MHEIDLSLRFDSVSTHRLKYRSPSLSDTIATIVATSKTEALVVATLYQSLSYRVVSCRVVSFRKPSPIETTGRGTIP